MRSKVTFFKNRKEIGWGRWDGRANARTDPININWEWRGIDFDEAVCKTEGGKVIIVKKDKSYRKKHI
jgi:hypothetical protein